MTHIIKCRIENILGAKEIEFEPNGQSITIGGKNGQGKSSAIWAIAMALGGKKLVPENPVNTDSDRDFGNISLELDNFFVNMVIDSEREVKLAVRSKQGIKYSTPRQILDELFSNLSFDPGEFKSYEKEKRIKTLLNVVGLDFSEIEAKQKYIYEQRTIKSREVTALENKLLGFEVFDDVPEDEIDAADVMQQIQECNEQHNVINNLATIIENNIEKFKYEQKQCEHLQFELTSLETKIEKIKHDIAAKDKTTLKLSETIYADNAKLQELKSNSGDVKEKSDNLLRSLKLVEETNKKVRHNKAYQQLAEEHNTQFKVVTQFNSELSQLKEAKEHVLKSAKFPIDGLSFDDGDVIFNGIPFAQLSESEQWKVSTAISFVLNKNSIVFLKQSGGLDSESREAIRKHAAECGVQLFMEVVDDASDVQILIEHGTIKENRLINAELSA